MNKKKIITTIIIDLIAIAMLVSAVYFLMFKELNEWQNNLFSVLVMVAMVVLFYSIFTSVAFSKYGRLENEDKLWEENTKDQEITAKSEDSERE